MKNFVRSALAHLISALKVNPDSLLYFAFHVHNIRPGQNSDRNGERYLLEQAKRIFGDEHKVVIFDVGANNGAYSVLARHVFPTASIYSFEPNYELAKASKYGDVTFFPIGLGSEEAEMELYVHDRSLGEATLYEAVSVYHQQVHQSEAGRRLKVKIDTVHNICSKENIGRISFMKIDTEGHELSVLHGCRSMIREGRIGIIQFEFNEMNVFSKVFLKDFYDLFGGGYLLYRLHRRSLFPLGSYKPHNEIFVWQNLVAVHKSLVHLL